MVDIVEKMDEFRIAIVSRDTHLADALGAELRDACAAVVHMSNCYEAAATILANPPHAMVIDLRCLTRHHLRLLEICSRSHTEILAVGTMPLGMTTSDLDGVRLCTPTSLAGQLRRLAEATGNTQGQPANASGRQPTPGQTDIPAIADDHPLDEMPTDLKDLAWWTMEQEDITENPVENIPTPSNEQDEQKEQHHDNEQITAEAPIAPTKPDEDNADTTQALAQWIIEASKVDTPERSDSLEESAISPAPVQEPATEPYTEYLAQPAQKAREDFDDVHPTKSLGELMTSDEISALLENE